MFLKIFVFYFFISLMSGCGGSVDPLVQRASVNTAASQQTPAPAPTPKSLVYSGTMNIEEKRTYREILAQNGVCANSSWSGGVYVGTSSCGSLEANPQVQLVLNSGKTEVQEFRIFPQYESNWYLSGASNPFPISLTPVNSQIYPINDSEGWEIRLQSKGTSSGNLAAILPPGINGPINYNGSFSGSFEIRLRCEYCDINTPSFEDVDIYRGIYSDGVRFGSVSRLEETQETQNP